MLGAYHPVIADNVQRLQGDLRPRRGVVPHVGHRGGDAGGAARALPHAALASGALLRRLSRLVGRRAAGRRQSAAGARDLHARRRCPRRRCACCARARDIACVLVNPLQALHPNAGAPSDSSLVDSARSAHFDRDAYTDWLKRLRAVCTERDIVLIFDEVFVGFRLAPGGAQEYFGVRADLVTYGKTLGGGLPVGVVCGRQRPDEALPRRPAGRHLLRPRHLQLASLRDGGDERVPAAPGDAASAGALPRPRRVWNAGASAQPAAARRGPAGARSPTCRRSGPSATRSRRATTGCCSITCAPRAWR